jgi:glycosyltransferase involved in cell wall biosynthesis
VATDRLRIALVTLGDPFDRRTWSGTVFRIREALESHAEVVCLGPLNQQFEIRFGRIITTLTYRFSGKRFDYNHFLPFARRHGRVFSRRLASSGCHAVVGVVASSALAFLETSLPIINVSDATVALIRDYYPTESAQFDFSERHGEELERLALTRSRLLLYPSEWAADSAVRHYGIPRDRIRVLPFGANLDAPPDKEAALNRRRGKVCRLLFLAKSWERKGGDVALAAFRSLTNLGIDTTLTVCGVRPPVGVADDPKIRLIPYLDKNVPEDMARLDTVLRESDLLILPTQADCFGIVFCEASAYGIPSLATATGGVPGAITDGENGVLLPPGATGEEYARAIAGIWGDDASYASWVKKARERFDQHLSWNIWGRSAVAAIKEVAR